MNKEKIHLALKLFREAMEESVESDFIRGEWVEVRDNSYEDWSLDRFRHFYINETNPYACYRFDWKQCRRPIDVHGIIIRWTGGDNPVPGKQVTVWLRNGDVQAGTSDNFIWKHRGNHRGHNDDIIEYRVGNIHG